MSILKDITLLLQEKVITEETAKDIEKFYSSRQKPATNRLVLTFSILGAILIGLGIILIIAHNWDNLSKIQRTLFAMIPLFIGQFLCFYTLWQKKDSKVWRESSATFLFFAVGASISLVSQIYNLPGDIGSFLFTWMLLCLPLVYLLNSSMVSILYLIGITFYAGITGYANEGEMSANYYWLLLLGITPFYYSLFKTEPTENGTTFHHYIYLLSIIICLGTFAGQADEFMLVAYMSFMGLIYNIGVSPIFDQSKLRNNAYRILGSLGSIVILLPLSFKWHWEHLMEKNLFHSVHFPSIEFFVALVITLASTILLLNRIKKNGIKHINPLSYVYLILAVLFMLGLVFAYIPLLINLLVLGVGVLIIRKGAQEDHLGILNYGLLILTALIACRFFDDNITFTIRGLLFITVGAGFYFTNYWIIKRRKQNEE